MTLGELPLMFRDRAGVMRECGAGQQADALEWAAKALEDALRSDASRELTLTEAVAESGYSRAHLHRMIREGKLIAAGRGRNRRILRRHLPRKPGHVRAPLADCTGATDTLVAQSARTAARLGVGP